MNATKPKLARIENEDVQQAYRRWAPFYDKSFGLITEAAVQEVTARANLFDGRLLEVGVGTGLALPHYKPKLDVTGIDLSLDMLKRARHRRPAAALIEMDATDLRFADGSFDVAVAMFVMTVVPDPQAVMHELARVTRPGGRVLICNHFSVDKGVRALLEKKLSKFAHKLGWRAEFPVETLLVDNRLELVAKTPLKPFGFFTFLEFRKRF
jgi:phosphatidylethanolamine/phosphatidyl-N-methylethanolamine N-methyltransferase